MKRFRRSSYLLLVIIQVCTVLSAQKASLEIKINDYVLTQEDVSHIKKIYGVDPLPGFYWYDTRSGVFGLIGGPAAGVMYPGHLFGTLSSTASNGRSGVFINGRQMQQSEAVVLARLFGYPQPIPGKYWLDANGDLGILGYALPFGNVYFAISQSQVSRNTSGSNFWTQGLYSGGNYYTGSNGRPSQGYVSVPGYGPISHGMN